MGPRMARGGECRGKLGDVDALGHGLVHMRLGAVVMAHDGDAGGRGAAHHVGADLRPARAGAFQKVVHHFAAGGLVDLHLVDHVGEPAVDVRALPVAGRVVHDRDKPRQGVARRRIHQRHGGRVRHLAAQVQQVVGPERALPPAFLERGDERTEDLATLGPLHRRAHGK